MVASSTVNIAYVSFRIHVLITFTSKVSSSLSFFPLRDSYGTTQLVVNRDSPEISLVLDSLATLPVESVVLIEGRVRLRPQNARRLSVSWHL